MHVIYGERQLWVIEGNVFSEHIKSHLWILACRLKFELNVAVSLTRGAFPQGNKYMNVVTISEDPHCL